MGNDVGDYIELSVEKDGENLSRYFYPISRIDEQGSFDIFVRLIKTDENIGVFSQILENSQPEQIFYLKNIDFKFKYLGFGKFLFKIENKTNAMENLSSIETIENIELVTLIIKHSNVSTFFQFIDTLVYYKKDDLQINVIYSVEDMVY